ncbi:MAG: hypothetical protein BGP25_13295 [Lysobacterales bacterium 63-13]|nr:MAG: hypothetical protein BGP25_13295 [Xanthomonadales bacterium 63-13]
MTSDRMAVRSECLMVKCVLLVAGLLMVGGVAAAEIPLKNAGFEQAIVGTRIPGWSRTQHAGVGAYVVSTDSNDPAHGKHSISMRRTTQQAYGLIMQRVESKELAGKPVAFTAKLKTADVGKRGWVMVMTFRDHENILDQVRAAPMTGDTAWTDVELKSIAPATTNMVEVGFLLLDGGTGWADHVRLRTLDDNGKDGGEGKSGAPPAAKAKPVKAKPAAAKPSAAGGSTHRGQAGVP